MDRVKPVVIAVAVLVTTAIAAPAVAGVATAQEQPQQIDECTTINESGAYGLNGSIGSANASANGTNATADAEAATENDTASSETSNNVSLQMETGVVEDDANASACLAVEASDVTVDGNNYTLDGSNASALNISANESADGTNVSVGDGASADANESLVNGIVIRPADGEDTVSNVTIRNVTVQNWYVGVYVQDAQGVTLENVTMQNNTVPGFRLDNSTGLSVQNVQESSN